MEGSSVHSHVADGAYGDWSTEPSVNSAAAHVALNVSDLRHRETASVKSAISGPNRRAREESKC